MDPVLRTLLIWSVPALVFAGFAVWAFVAVNWQRDDDRTGTDSDGDPT
jgi:hypothetical protein